MPVQSQSGMPLTFAGIKEFVVTPVCASSPATSGLCLQTSGFFVEQLAHQLIKCFGNLQGLLRRNLADELPGLVVDYLDDRMFGLGID